METVQLGQTGVEVNRIERSSWPGLWRVGRAADRQSGGLCRGWDDYRDCCQYRS